MTARTWRNFGEFDLAGANDWQSAGVLRLGDLQAGESARIVGIDADFAHGARFAELGFTDGVTVGVLRRALFGDPVEILIRGTRYALRRADAAKIRVVRLP